MKNDKTNHGFVISAIVFAIPISMLNIASIAKAGMHIIKSPILCQDVESIVFAIISILLSCTIIITSLVLDETEKPGILIKQMAISAIYAIICELIAPYEIQSGIMLVVPVCLVSVLTYASISLLRYWSAVILSSYLFVVLILRVIYMQCQVGCDAHLLSQILWPSPNDVEKFITIKNILLISAIIILSISICCILIKIFGRCSKKAALVNSLLLGACIVCAGRAHQPTMNALKNYNPEISCALYNIVNGYILANEIKDSCISKLEALPSPSTEGSSIHTLKGNEGCICILHIGESVRSDRLSLNGYVKDTTPWLRAQEQIINFENCTSIAPLTTDAFPTILTNARGNMSMHISNEVDATVGCVMDLFADNTFECYAFVGCPSHLEMNAAWAGIFERMLPLFTRKVKKVYSYKKIGGSDLPKQQIKQIVNAYESAKCNCFFLVNNNGSHLPFASYDINNPKFTPSDTQAYSSLNRDDADTALRINNAYDNTIAYTDEYIRDLLENFKGKPYIYIYVSDHGEPLGEQGLWTRQFKDYHKMNYCKVPFFIIYSNEFESLHLHFAEAIQQMRRNIHVSVAHENIFHTLLGIFSIRTPYYDPHYDVSSPSLEPYHGPAPERGGNSDDNLKWE